jgi:hypothetical protein
VHAEFLRKCVENCNYNVRASRHALLPAAFVLLHSSVSNVRTFFLCTASICSRFYGWLVVPVLSDVPTGFSSKTHPMCTRRTLSLLEVCSIEAARPSMVNKETEAEAEAKVGIISLCLFQLAICTAAVAFR